MDHPSRNFEGSNPGASADCGGPALEVSERPRDCPCNILLENVPSFCCCPKNLSEAKLKSTGLLSLVEAA